MEITELKKDLAATFRWTARLNMNEGVANHFSACVPGSTDEFLVKKKNPLQMPPDIDKMPDPEMVLIHLKMTVIKMSKKYLN